MAKSLSVSRGFENPQTVFSRDKILINPGIRSKLCLTLWYLVTEISKPLFNRYIDTGPFFCYLGENTNVVTMYFPGDFEVSWISLPDYEQTSRYYYKY